MEQHQASLYCKTSTGTHSHVRSLWQPQLRQLHTLLHLHWLVRNTAKSNHLALPNWSCFGGYFTDRSVEAISRFWYELSLAEWE